MSYAHTYSADSQKTHNKVVSGTTMKSTNFLLFLIHPVILCTDCYVLEFCWIKHSNPTPVTSTLYSPLQFYITLCCHSVFLRWNAYQLVKTRHGWMRWHQRRWDKTCLVHGHQCEKDAGGCYCNMCIGDLDRMTTKYTVYGKKSSVLQQFYKISTIHKSKVTYELLIT
jgi:hypothetical protein